MACASAAALAEALVAAADGALPDDVFARYPEQGGGCAAAIIYNHGCG